MDLKTILQAAAGTLVGLAAWEMGVRDAVSGFGGSK